MYNIFKKAERGVGYMATRTANLYARIEPEVKQQAEEILTSLGIPVSNAINMFYRQIILQRGLPFEVKLPVEKPLSVGGMSEEQLNKEPEKGYTDILNGRAKPAKTDLGSALHCLDDMRLSLGNQEG